MVVVGFVNPPGIIILIISPFDYFRLNGPLKVLISWTWGKEGMKGGGLVPSNEIWLLKRELEIIISDLMTSSKAYNINPCI